MNLLPKASSEFATEKYWNEFFRKRGKKAFDWYGEYWQLCGILHKYLKANDKILVIGCGNSSLSADLYDNGYMSNISIDISDVVIKKMKEKYTRTRPKMIYQQMDVAQMSFPDDEFSVVIDKGTVDALASDREDGSTAKLSAIFAEVARVLRVGGRFICVSLLQQHVMKTLLEWFSTQPQWTWVIRIHRCEEAEQTESTGSLVLPVFVVVFTKMKRIPSIDKVLELALALDSKPVRVPDLNAVYAEVCSQQRYAFIRHHFARRKLEASDVVSLELFSPSSNVPRYRLHVCDRLSTSPLKFAIFIVPQGRETEWLFGSPEGRQQLAESCSAERLVVVHLSRDHQYESLEQVNAELSQKVMELAPSSYQEGKKVPFLSTGEDVGQRQVRQRGKSALSGDYVVEDVTLENNTIVRRLIFLDKPHVVQTEARLKTARSKKKGKAVEVDTDYLPCEYYKYMVASLAFIMPKAVDQEATALLLGLGGGTLAAYLTSKFPKLKLSVVELDPTVVSLARDWYLPSDISLDITVEDALVTTQRCADEGKTYDIVLVDVDSKDLSQGLTCPPEAFLETKVIKTLSKITSGVVAMNFVCRNEALKSTIYERLRESFETICAKKIPDEVNEVLYLSRCRQDVKSDAILQGARRLGSVVGGAGGGDDVSDLLEGLRVV